MYEYRAPRREIRFVLHEVLDVEKTLAAAGRDDVNRELVDGILDAGAQFSEEVLSPLNWKGDWQGPKLEDGRVVTPPGFKEAYQQFCRDGWAGMAADPEVGGQGLPDVAYIAVGEMLCGAAMAWRMASGLSEGAVLALHRHGSETLKAAYLAKLVSGEWTGTMCLTEPHSGTDLGIMRTKAEPQPDGSYAVSGTKIYISWGEHDMADNIVHLVLAKLPDAPSGTRGISLFLVPKLLDGQPNGVSCSSIEHKMGIHGSPTCVLNFEGSKGWLVGQPNGGLACMFTMMNHARLGVGLQGLGLSERSLQASVAYAFERLQGRSPRGAQAKERMADPIIVHPDVRRMVLEQKATTEAQRLLCYYSYLLIDVERHAPDEAVRKRAGELVALLVPIVKAVLTDTAVVNAGLAIQVHGGAGYIRDTGVEQYLRDAKIACIYEGTNGIQALDLLGRKVLGTGGASVKLMIDEIARSLAVDVHAEHRPWAQRVQSLLQEWGELTKLVAERAARDPEELAAAATDYLQFAGHVLVAWCWLRMAGVAQRALDGGSAERGFYEGKLLAARFYFDRLLPRAEAHAAAVRAGAATIPAVTAEHLGT
jgi:alkylation response protein AidB-like acyl-CoA dehydrogenase